MFRNYLATAWRSARRDRFYALLNVFGLALGFAVAIVIWLFVRYELSYNSFLPGYQDVYWIRLTIAETGQRPVTLRGTPARMAAELKLDFPEIVATTRTRTQYVGLRHGDVEAVENILWVDADFFAVLGYRLLRGDPATALAEPNSIVLTRTLASKYFGTTDCLGQTLEIDHLHPMRVTGIAEDPPSNATESFDALLSGKTAWSKLAIADATAPSPGELDLTGKTFVRLRPGVNPDNLSTRFPAFALSHYPDPEGPRPLFASMFMHSLADVHLNPYNPDTSEPNDQEQMLYAVAATGLLILLLAGINFVNLATARATRRAVEVGVRKGLGALRSQLMVQFMGESVCYSLAGLLLGVGLAEFFLPSLNALLDRQIAFDFLRHPLLAIVPLATAMLFGIAAGVYPAVILSRFPPAQMLKARAGASIGGGRVRLGLVVFQFTVTIALLIATIVIHRQLSFATSQALRFDKDLMLTIDLTGMPEQVTPDGLGRREAAPLEALRTRLAAVPGVRAMAATFTLPLWHYSLTTDFVRPGQSKGQSVNFTIQSVDFGYFGVYRVPLLAGRDFARDFVEDKVAADDKSRLSSAIINETALRALGFTDASAAIGQEVQSTDSGSPRRHRIIGVAPDFPLDSIRDPVPPSIFIVDPDLFKVLSLKLSGSNLPETLRGIDAAWHEFMPERPINRVFLDDRIAELYRDVAHEGRVFAAFAGFAVAIGCLGLIGLSAYTAERRTKEIGIRKALGASTFDVSWLLIRQFTKPVLLANVLAWPIAWWFMRGWLDGFAYRIDLGPEPFLGAGLGAIAIAIATTASHAVQVARSRPVGALRYE
ncbi:MAG TPA: ABC transporter permease [Xanthobacteraceae bacterium]|jgi:putative ABC transport system permease protein